MKLIRKYDVFKELTKYAEGELALGECIDNCPTLDVTELINKIDDILRHLYVIDETEEKLEKLVEELRGWEND